MRRLAARAAAILLAIAAALPGAGAGAQEDAAADESAGAPASPTITLPPRPSSVDVDGQPLRSACPVPPAAQWSPVETDAWQKICVGLAANLGAQPKAGATQQNVQLPRGVMSERALSTAFLYQILSDPLYAGAITFRGVVIRNADFPEPVNLSYLTLDKPLHIEQSRFFQPLLLRHLRSRSEVDLSRSAFLYQPPQPPKPSQPGPSQLAPMQPVPFSLDLTEARIDLSLTLDGISAGDVDLSDTVIGRHIMLDNAAIFGRLYSNGARIGGMLWLRNVQLDHGWSGRFMDVAKNVVIRFVLAAQPRIVNDEPDWHDLSRADITLSNSRIQGSLTIGRGVDIEMPQELSQLARDEAEAEQLQAESQVAGQSTKLPEIAPIIGESEDARFAGQRFDVAVDLLDLGQIEVGGEIAVRDSRIGYLNLEDARSGGDMWLTNAEVSDANMSAVDVGGFLLLQDTTILDLLSLESAEVGRHLTMSPKTLIEKNLHMPSLVVHGGFYANGATVVGVVDLQSASIGGDMLLTRGTTFESPIDAGFARIGQSLDLNGGKFASVNLTGASIGSELRLVGDRSSAEFEATALLDLRNARADSLQDVTDAWPDNLELVGFTYRQFGGSETVRGNGTPAGSQSQPAEFGGTREIKSCGPGLDPIAFVMIDRDAEPHDPFKLLCWLQGQKPFSPAPYTQLANVLRQAGEAETAAAVLYGGRMRQWDEKHWLYRAAPSIFVPWALTGFGNYPKCTIFWIVVLVLLGVAIFSRDPAPELQSFNLLQRVVYSVDMLMPVVHLRHHHYEIELRAWPRYYLYFHKIAGYVLLTFLAAALIGGGGLE